MKSDYEDTKKKKWPKQNNLITFGNYKIFEQLK